MLLGAGTDYVLSHLCRSNSSTCAGHTHVRPGMHCWQPQA